MRCRAKTLFCFWLSYVVFVSSAYKEGPVHFVLNDSLDVVGLWKPILLFLCRPNTVFIKHGSTKLGLHASDCTLVWLFNNINNQCFVCLSLVVYPRNTWRRTRKVLRVYKHLAFVCDCECYLHHVISPCTWCKDTKVLFKQRLLNTCALFSG